MESAPLSTRSGTTCYHVKLTLTEHAYQHWKQVGQSRALASDSDIACFLLWMYERSNPDQDFSLSCTLCKRDKCESAQSLSTGRDTDSEDRPHSRHSPLSVLPELANDYMVYRLRREAMEKAWQQELTDQDDHLPVYFGQQQESSSSLDSGNDTFSVDKTSESHSQSGQGFTQTLSESDVKQEACGDEEDGQQSCELQDDVQSEQHEDKEECRKKGKSKQHMDESAACPQCGVRLSRARDLKIHLRIHTGEKPFVCKVCSRAFTQKCSLRRHMTVHDDVQPSACPHCGDSLLNVSLRVHLKTCPKWPSQFYPVRIMQSTSKEFSANQTEDDGKMSDKQTYSRKAQNLCVSSVTSSVVQEKINQIMSLAAGRSKLMGETSLETSREDMYLDGKPGEVVKAHSHSPSHVSSGQFPYIQNQESERKGPILNQREDTGRHQTEKFEPSTRQQEPPAEGCDEEKPLTSPGSTVVGQHWNYVYDQQFLSETDEDWKKKEDINHRLDRPLRRDGNVSSPVNCPEYGLQIPPARDLRVHRRAHSGEKSYSCSQCLRVFMKKSSLYAHMETHDQQAMDLTCARSVRSSERNFANSQLSCEKMETSGASDDGPEREREKSAVETQGPQEASTSSSQARQVTASSPTNSTAVEHPLALNCRIKVEECDQTENISSDNHCDRPSDLPSNQTIPSFPSQQKTTGKKRSGRSPRSISQAPQCPVCGITVSTHKNLKLHMVIHGNEKPYLCNECGQGFRQTGGLVVHMRKHRNERPFVCHICTASFPLRGSLNVHLRTHSDIKPFSCKECSRTFVRASDLKIHMARHFGIKDHVCSTCNQSFVTSSELIRHVRLHTGEKPYRCAVCQKGFRLKKTWNEHQRIHTKDKPYLCPTCGKRFTYGSSFDTHCRLHTGTQRYQCTHCEKDFSTRFNLKQHLWYKHQLTE